MHINCVAEKTTPQSSSVTSVAFSPDGTKIVSVLADGTINIWDATPRPFTASEWEAVKGVFPGTHPWENQKSITYWENTVTGDFRREHTSAGAVQPRTDRMLEIGCAGALNHPIHGHKTDAFWLVWQARWCC